MEEILDKKADLTNLEEQFTQAQEDFKKTVYNYNQKMEYETFKIQQEKELIESNKNLLREKLMPDTNITKHDFKHEQSLLSMTSSVGTLSRIQA